MITRWLVGYVHLLAYGLGLATVLLRARALKGPLDRAGLSKVFVADNLWGVAFLLLVGTGLWRLLGGLEKPTGYYFNNHVFWTKMVLVVLLLAIETPVMISLIRWRIGTAKGQVVDTSRAPRFARVSHIEAGLVALIVLLASGMARGLGM